MVSESQLEKGTSNVHIQHTSFARIAFTEYTAVGGGGRTPRKDPGNDLIKDDGVSDMVDTVR